MHISSHGLYNDDDDDDDNNNNNNNNNFRLRNQDLTT